MTEAQSTEGSSAVTSGNHSALFWSPEPPTPPQRKSFVPFSALPVGLAHRYSSTGAAIAIERYPESVDDAAVLADTGILIVDDCTLYRDYLAAVFVSFGAGPPRVAWDLPSLIESMESTLQDVILINVRTRDSATLLRQVLLLHPTARVVAFGLSADNENEIIGCAEAGVAGYHLRSESLDDLIAVIHNVAAGEFLCSPDVSAILLQRLSTLAAQRQRPSYELVLTTREIQILGMLEAGLSNQEIADRLCIAIHTVKNHVHSLLTKLGVSSRAQAAALARTVLPIEGSS